MSTVAAAARHGGGALADAWMKDAHLAPHGFPSRTAELVRAMLRDNVGLFVEPPASVAPGSARGRLGRLAAPGHVLVGEHDDPDNHAVAQTLAREARALELHVVPGAGHFPMLEQIGWLPQRLAELLDRLDPP
jgi:pimeloyl-ACP methyl ester carboxylesterase